MLAGEIHLDAPVPHIYITARERGAAKREIKNATSERQIPLVGIALEAMQRHPQGFPRYREKTDSFSAAVNKSLRTMAWPRPRRIPSMACATASRIA